MTAPRIRSLNALPPPQQLLRLPEVIARTGRSKAGLYAMIRINEFPKPLRVGRRAVAWRATDVAAWVNSRETCVYSPLPGAADRAEAA